MNQTGEAGYEGARGLRPPAVRTTRLPQRLESQVQLTSFPRKINHRSCPRLTSPQRAFISVRGFLKLMSLHILFTSYRFTLAGTQFGM